MRDFPQRHTAHPYPITKPAYAALSVQTRELVIINMWAGQFLCEGFNWLLKRMIKQDRPSGACLFNA
jgi:hypothetical protein